jgi:hypothetical protein
LIPCAQWPLCADITCLCVSLLVMHKFILIFAELGSQHRSDSTKYFKDA